MILAQEIAVFLLEGPGPMMFFLVVDVFHQILQLAPTDGEGAISCLPLKRRVWIALGLDPGGRGLFDFFEEFGLGEGAGQSGGDVDVVGGPADAVGLAFTIATDGGQVGVHAWPDGGVEQGTAVFGAKDDVEDDLAEGLRHRGGVLA